MPIRSFKTRDIPQLCEAIRSDPLLATEANVTLLLKAVLDVHRSEGKRLDQFDSNVQPYYTEEYIVTVNEEVHSAIALIARSNPNAFLELHKKLMKELRRSSIGNQITSSDTHLDTTYVTDEESEQNAVKIREIIYRQIEELFRSSTGDAMEKFRSLDQAAKH